MATPNARIPIRQVSPAAHRTRLPPPCSATGTPVYVQRLALEFVPKGVFLRSDDDAVCLFVLQGCQQRGAPVGDTCNATGAAGLGDCPGSQRQQQNRQQANPMPHLGPAHVAHDWSLRIVYRWPGVASVASTLRLWPSGDGARAHS